MNDELDRTAEAQQTVADPDFDFDQTIAPRRSVPDPDFDSDQAVEPQQTVADPDFGFDQTIAPRRSVPDPDFDSDQAVEPQQVVSDLDFDFDQTVVPQHTPVQLPDSDRNMPFASSRNRKKEVRFKPGDLLINRYKVLGELGQGGMGVVYKCFDEMTGVEVALKALTPELSSNTLEMARIRDNFQLIHNLSHPNIAGYNMLERNPENGNYYIIMEYCEGEDLRRWIKHRRNEDRFSWEDVLLIIRQIADALDYAHKVKIIHRDIKPGNIMIDDKGRIKVLDFGLAASMDQNGQICQSTSGTASYMAPEQWRGEVQGEAADQYALAVMIYEMLTGELPFSSVDPGILRQAVLTQNAEPVIGLHKDAQNALDRAMSKDPADRFESCSEFVAVLQSVENAEAEPESANKNKILKWSIVAGGAVLLILGTLFLMYLAGNRKDASANGLSEAELERRIQEEVAKRSEIIEDNIEKTAQSQTQTVEERVAEGIRLAEKRDRERLQQTAAAQKLKISTDGKEISGVLNKDISTVKIPDGITSIGERAFDGCTNLTNIAIPNSVTSIGNRAFNGCSKLEQITIPDNVTSIGDRAFYNCANLKYIIAPKHLSVRVPDGCKVYHSEAKAAQMEAKMATLHAAAAAQKLQLRNDGIVTGVTDKSVTEVVIPDGVTGIGNYAFDGCTSLTSITIPNSVTHIGERAFDGCTNLASITIPNSVMSIGRWTFSDCVNMKYIIAPKHLSVRAPENCNVYRSEAEAAKMESLRAAAAAQKLHLSNNGIVTGVIDKSVTEVVIPDGVTGIGDRAFSGCSKLRRISIPDSVTSIGYWAFDGCTNLTNITIPNSVTSIGYRAFNNCSELEKITIPSRVMRIARDVFDGCAKLKYIIVPAHLSVRVPAGCKVYHSVADVAKMESVNASSAVQKLQLSTDCTTVIGVADKSVTNVVIPEGVTSIGDYAFRDCSKLREITIPNSVTSIGDGAFYGCTSLSDIVIPNSVTSIGYFAFSGCTNLKYIIAPKHLSVHVPDGCKVYYTEAEAAKMESLRAAAAAQKLQLRDNGIVIGVTDKSIAKVEIPEGVTGIGRYAFRDCSKLREITIPNSVTSIGDGAFSGCTSLSDIVIPNSVTSIEDRAFDGCSKLRRISIPDSVTRIGRETFSGCTSLTDIVIPNSVTHIGREAFSSCTSLSDIVIPNSVTSIEDRAFGGCSKLRRISIPDSVTRIGDYVFSGCTSLSDIVIPEGVTGIGDYAFRGCSKLRKITIPNSVTNFGFDVFDDCDSLRQIVYPKKFMRDGEKRRQTVSYRTSDGEERKRKIIYK